MSLSGCPFLGRRFQCHCLMFFVSCFNLLQWIPAPGDWEFVAFRTYPNLLIISTLSQNLKLAAMADWGPVVVALVLFVLLTPGLIFQLPGKSRVVEFNNFQTSGASICVHSVIFFGLITIFLIAIGVHIYT